MHVDSMAPSVPTDVSLCGLDNPFGPAVDLLQEPTAVIRLERARGERYVGPHASFQKFSWKSVSARELRFLEIFLEICDWVTMELPPAFVRSIVLLTHRVDPFVHPSCSDTTTGL